jgi:phosphatidylserine/phosphatidylglycerophosphate/cardiolipin synthase-like enzyme
LSQTGYLVEPAGPAGSLCYHFDVSPGRQLSSGVNCGDGSAGLRACGQNFAKALQRDDEGTDETHVAVIGETEGAHHGKPDVDYRSIPAGAVRKDDAFGAWEGELYSAGHAIIHDKIVVIDPFSDNCVVVTGSHNLGWRASHNNDENFVSVHGHRSLAEAYACHVLDVYDHYAWRWWLAKQPNTFGRPLDSSADWQNRYISNGQTKSPELRFWLAATPSVVAHEVVGARKTPAAKMSPLHRSR